MRPFLEKLPWQSDSSLAMLNRRLEDAIPFQWHHHPEYELTLTLNSHGQRFIGDHVGRYGDGDLVLVGPNLPHTWVSETAIDPDQPHVALVIWFDPAWADRASDCFVEFAKVRTLLERADRSLSFSADIANSVRPDIEAFFTQTPQERLLSLLSILDRLSADHAAVPLARAPVQRAGIGESRARIDRVLIHIHRHYMTPISMEDLADIAALSVSGLHRLFIKHNQNSVSQYIMELRIGDACARLSGTDQPIGFIAQAVGYASAANFNRRFLALKGMTPRQYRAHFRQAA